MAEDALPTLKLALGIPAYGGTISANHARMWLAVGRALSMFGARFELVMIGHVDTNGVQRARNRLVAEAMKAGAQWLLMLDADTWVEAHNDNNPTAAGYALLRMISDAAQARIAVVSAPVRIRDEGIGGERIAAYLADGSLIDPKQILRGLQDVEAVGAACLGIDLHAVVTADAFFEFAIRDHVETGEDREFCRQMKKAGFRIALDGRIRTGHLSRAFPLYSE